MRKTHSKQRFQHNRESADTISDPTEADPTLIQCPKCRAKAAVYLLENGDMFSWHARAVCSSCGFTKEKITNMRIFHWQEENPTDGFFQYPLWMQISCCGRPLWVFNKRHLDFLESYVRAELREHPPQPEGYYNNTLASRLPEWIKSRKNRKQILHCLKKLKESGGFEKK